MKHPLHSLLASALVIAGTATTHAALIAYDGFESYTVGTSINGGSGGTGWGSNNWVGSEANTGDAAAITKTMSYSGGDVSVNGGSTALRLQNDNGHLAIRSYAAQTGTVYISYLFETNDSSEFFQQWNTGRENFDGADTDSASVMQRLDGSTEKFGARLNSNSTQNFGSSPTVANNTTYFVVARMSKDGTGYYNMMDMMINPTSLTEPGSWDITNVQNTDTGLNELTSLGFRLVGLSTGDQYFIDEIRVGSSYDAVVIPEPSTFLLMGVALTAVVFFRRRR
jgi:hypothetical protein